MATCHQDVEPFESMRQCVLEAITAASLVKWPIWISMVIFLEAIYTNQPPGGGHMGGGGD